MSAKTVSASRVTVTLFAQPEHANFHGTMHGGHIVKLADEAGAMAAMRHARNSVVTVFIDSMTFDRPVRMGHILHFHAEVSYVGRTSIETWVQVLAENPLTGTTEATNSAYFVYVAVDEKGKPVPVPSLELETPAEEARFVAGKKRQEYRLKARG
jgi:uncharacterized protein (TIGR00369 family)